MVLDWNILATRLGCSPFYRDKLFRAGLTPKDLSVASLSQFPFTERAELFENSDRIPAWREESECEETHIYSSSGTSGPKLQVFRGEADELRTLRIWEQAAQRTLPLNLRILFVCTMGRPKEYLVRKQVGPYTLVIERIPSERLRRMPRVEGEFEILSGTPRGLATVTGKINPDTLLLAYSTALPMAMDQASELHRHLRHAHLHCYSMTECGPIARWCRDCGGAYHVFSDIHIEAISGRLCITKLSDSVFPLLRYLTDDHGELSSGLCPCGFDGMTISELVGRKAEDFYQG